jgi:hypothetical protein
MSYLFIFVYVLDSPICSSKSLFPWQIFAALGRPINIACHMHNGNPSKLNFTWHLPNGHIRLGRDLNATSSSLSLIPYRHDEFGSIICQAQNELGLAGQCHLKMVLGGEGIDRMTTNTCVVHTRLIHV